ncbi:MAG: nuclear transport factor 2 family protein [Acidobacteriota bacterium]
MRISFPSTLVPSALFRLATAFLTFGIVLAPNAAAQKPASSAEALRLRKLETGTERAESLRSAKRLQYAFSQFQEAGLWTDLAELFSKDVTMEVISGKTSVETITGRDALKAYWMHRANRQAAGLAEGQLNEHLQLQPIVNLTSDGKAALGTWHEISLLGTFGTSASWEGGIYENEYAPENGVWKIHKIHFYQQYSGANDAPGWKGTVWSIPYHFTGEHVGLSIPASALLVSDVATPVTPAAMSTRLARAEARIQQMNDETEVRNLQNTYGYYMDRKLWDDVADLFADKGSWESGQRGVYVGHTQIRKALETIYGAPALRFGELFDHLNLGSVVTIAADGRTAAARTTELCQLGLNNEFARWELGTYENEFVKEAGVWKLSTVHYFPRMITDYDKGWAKDAQKAPGASNEFPPARRSASLEIYPKFSFPAFHYANPVTGRALQYPQGVIRAVKPVAVAANAVASHTGDLTARLTDAERELSRAIGVDAVENQMSSYGYYLDDGASDEMANTFGRKGAKEITGAGVYVGSESIRAILKLRGPIGLGPNSTSFTIHQLTQPVIHVSEDGLSAKARLRLFQGGGRLDGASASWIGGTYENTAFFEDGEWKFGVQDLHHHYNATYKNGWAKLAVRGAAPAAPAKPTAATPTQAQLAAAKAKAPARPSLASQLPPDHPIRARQYVFPEIDEPAFHYRNPVSGRMPKQLLP